MLLHELLQGFYVVHEDHGVKLIDRRSVLTEVDEKVEVVMHDEALRGESGLKAELHRRGHGQVQGHECTE